MLDATAVDLFAGCGGATTGLTQAGFRVVAAVENDPVAAASFAANHRETRLLDTDIRLVSPASLRAELGMEKGELTLLKACPPCQGYSSRGSADGDDPRNDLVREVWPFISEFRPRTVLLENVVGLSRDVRLARLERQMRGSGYRVRRLVLDATECGVPQRRRRLIVVGVRSPVAVPEQPDEWLSLTQPLPVEAALRGAARVRNDPLARTRTVSEEVQRRIDAIPIGGSRYDLPDALQLPCHRKVDAAGRRAATESYGRMETGKPAPTMTTKCTTASSGRFIHPTENRAITLREASMIQGFPPDYDFKGGYDRIERQIGNAIPVGMARTLGRGLIQLVGSHG